jgi:hypothetical protein
MKELLSLHKHTVQYFSVQVRKKSHNCVSSRDRDTTLKLAEICIIARRG